MKQEINFLHSEIKNLEKLNLEKDKLIKSLKSQVETKTKIINYLEKENIKLTKFPLAHIDTTRLIL